MNNRQGSITALLNPNGTVAEKYSYDAYGRRRNPANWNDYNMPAPSLINRGYTGHEHLDGFGLINMNGRMYDPVIGRVLSPDAFVQAPGYTQSYNRYSYCMNNPLKYIDPSGWTAFKNWSEFWTEVNYLWDNGGGNWNSSSGSSSVGNEGGTMQAAANAISGSNGWGYTNFPNGATVVEHSYLNGETTHLSKTTGWTVESHDAVWYEFVARQRQPGPLSSGLLYPYSNENAAYRVMWAMSHSSNGDWNSESYGVLTNKGVYILPNAGFIKGKFYSNKFSKAEFAEAWMNNFVVNRQIIGTNINIIATIHTHPLVGVDGYPYDIGISEGDKSLYQYGNIYMFNEDRLFMGYRSSDNSDIFQWDVTSFENITNNNWSIYNYNKRIPYYPY